jgi:hypothetical protein
MSQAEQEGWRYKPDGWIILSRGRDALIGFVEEKGEQIFSPLCL